MTLIVLPEIYKLDYSNLYLCAIGVFIIYFAFKIKLKFTSKRKYLNIIYAISEYICKFALVCFALWLIWSNYIVFLFSNTHIIW